jgi:hypothetical protein
MATQEVWTDDDVANALKMKSDNDFFFFLKEVCEFGHNDNPTGPRITEDQHELCNWLQAIYEGKKEVTKSQWLHMILTPRDTLKSTVLQGFALWILCKNPEARILFYGEVHEQAQKRLAVIKRIISTCPTFIMCYGSLDGSVLGLPWNENLIVISTRKSTSTREGSIETAGLNVTINARHFDWIFPDDLHSEANTKSRDQIENVREKVQLLMPLLTKGGNMIFAGVFWNDSDFHTKLIEENHPNLFRRSAYADEAKTIPAYPNVLPLVELVKKQMFMSGDQFSCHYLLDPVSKSSQKFRRDYFAIIPDKEFRCERTFLLIDPAGDSTSEKSEKKDSDYYGFVVVGVNQFMDICIRNMFMERLNPTEAIEVALSLTLRYNPYIIGIEKSGLGSMRHYIEEELRKRGRFAIVEDLLPAGRSKYARVVALEPLARRHKIYIATESACQEEFFDQITKVTNGLKSKHDDLEDPLAYILDVLKTYGIGEIDTDGENVIPPEYRNLDAVSRDYWMSVRKSKTAKAEIGFASEFEKS